MFTILLILFMTTCFFYIVVSTQILEKAGKNGWWALVPIYNMILFCEIVSFTTLETVLMFVPFANIVMIVIFSLKLAKCFGKSEAFGIGLWLLGMIFYPILAFGDASYDRTPATYTRFVKKSCCRTQA